MGQKVGEGRGKGPPLMHHARLPNRERAERPPHRHAVDDDVIHGQYVLAFDREHDSAFSTMENDGGGGGGRKERKLGDDDRVNECAHDITLGQAGKFGRAKGRGHRERPVAIMIRAGTISPECMILSICRSVGVREGETEIEIRRVFDDGSNHKPQPMASIDGWIPHSLPPSLPPSNQRPR